MDNAETTLPVIPATFPFTRPGAARRAPGARGPISGTRLHAAEDPRRQSSEPRDDSTSKPTGSGPTTQIDPVNTEEKAPDPPPIGKGGAPPP